MILSDFVLPDRANQHWEYSGLDNPQDCLDPKHFQRYPHTVSYQYNNRGFRGQHWPDTLDQLQTATWCLGDSFTVGLGCPEAYAWPSVLNRRTEQLTINAGMDGASNDWLARKAIDVLTQINPKLMIIHWSFVHRRELALDLVIEPEWQRFYNGIKDPSWPDCDSVYLANTLPTNIQQEIKDIHNFDIEQLKKGTYFDEQRRLYHNGVFDTPADINHLVKRIEEVERAKQNTKIIHSIIPGGMDCYLTEPAYLEFNRWVNDLSVTWIPEFVKLDLARDGFHYDVKTAEYFVQQIVDLL